MSYYALTDIGKVRDCNEDYYFATDEPVGDLPNLYIVADGMGGANAGEYASEFTVNSVVDKIRTASILPDLTVFDAICDVIREAITITNWQLHDISRRDKDKAGMGTTLVVATILDDHMIVANVGDSRAYTYSQQVIRQVTMDHSYVEELVRRGEMTPEEAKVSSYKNRITRAIGAEPSVRIDFFDVPIVDIDRVILCTDGLTNMLDDEAIADVITGADDIRSETEKLMSFSLDAGGVDNITIVDIDLSDNASNK